MGDDVPRTPPTDWGSGGPLRRALDTTLDALDLAPEAQAAAELARQLADEIDRARSAERVADRALRRAQDEDRDETVEELIRALKLKVSHRDAIVRCGQRLEAVLAALQATPAAASKAGGGSVLPAGGPLAVLRGGRTG